MEHSSLLRLRHVQPRRRLQEEPLFQRSLQGKAPSLNSIGGGGLTGVLLQQLMSAVSKCFSSDKEGSTLNGETARTGKRKKNPVNGVNNSSSDEVGGSYSSDSGGSPLSVLADVALNSSGKMEGGGKGAEEEDEKGDDFSTLRELLIRPTGGNSKKSSVEEVVTTVIAQTVAKKEEEQQLLHFCRRFPNSQAGRDALPVRVCTLAESSLLYPKVPHSWLCNGKLLVLHEPRNKNNLLVFQEQWKRGQVSVLCILNATEAHWV